VYSKLPGEFGETPPKIVILGTGGDKALAIRLFNLNAGPINAFQSKARMQRLMSGDRTTFMHQELPDGGSLHYNYNNGQETIYVELRPEIISAAEQDPELRKRPPYPPILAVDVVFEPERYSAYNIFSVSSNSNFPLAEGRRFFNHRNILTEWTDLNVVGLISGPEDEKYEATSAGSSTDSRLEPLFLVTERDFEVNPQTGLAPLVPDETFLVADREVSAEGEPPPGYSGAGFLVKPVTPTAPPGEPGVTKIDVYIASLDLSVTNEFPGPNRWNEFNIFNGIPFDRDFVRSYGKQLSFRIRVREFTEGETLPVYVVPIVEHKDEGFQTERPGFPDASTSVPIAPRYDVSFEDVRWGFAATKKWEDKGMEPADPTAEGMGLLLAESDLLVRTVANTNPTPENDPPVIYYERVWTLGVEAMTHVATIEWTPSTAPGAGGAATIKPA